MRKKILHVINSMTSGGAETLLANSLSPGGLQQHTDNTIVYFRGASHLIDGIDKYVKIYCLNYKGIFSLPTTLLKLRRIIKQHKINIVHSHLNPASFYTHLISPANVPQVHTVHTTYSMDTETSPFKRYLERQLYFKRKSCNVILLSTFTKEDFLKAIPFKGRAFVLNNFVPDIFFKSEAKKNEGAGPCLKLVAVGTLKKLKNFEYLLEVFKYLKNEEIYLDIYGDGDKTKYEDIIKLNGLKVRMMGYKEDLSDILPGYNLFIMPSKFEGFPLSLFEAMASGVPLLLSNIAPLKSIAGEHAIYLDLDNAEAVSTIIQSILNKKIDISSMAKNAKAYAEKTVKREIYINKLLAIYEELLQYREPVQ
jgi:glycosyltransferase involved in cell wall biosynthesis